MVRTHPLILEEGDGLEKDVRGFRYFDTHRLFLKKEPSGVVDLITKEYNATDNANAMAKHEGFVYNPQLRPFTETGKSTEKGLHLYYQFHHR